MSDREKVMSWLEGLAEPDWRDFHSDSEVQNIAKSALALLKEQEAKIEQLNRFVNGFSRDAMPVVRCKDCNHRDPEDHKCDHHWHAYSPLPVDDDFWCAYGERYTK